MVQQEGEPLLGQPSARPVGQRDRDGTFQPRLTAIYELSSSLSRQDFERSQEDFSRSTLTRAVSDKSRTLVWMILFLSIWCVLFQVGGVPEVSDAIFVKFLKDSCDTILDSIAINYRFGPKTKNQ